LQTAKQTQTQLPKKKKKEAREEAGGKIELWLKKHAAGKSKKSRRIGDFREWKDRTGEGKNKKRVNKTPRGLWDNRDLQKKNFGENRRIGT